MNASVDEEVCTGCELCTKTCPEVFQMESGKARVTASTIPGDLEFICRLVAGDCPANAIYVGQAHALMLVASNSRNHSWIAL